MEAWSEFLEEPRLLDTKFATRSTRLEYWEELYDLATDPLEVENLAGQSGVFDVEASLLAELMHNYDPEAVNDACIQSQKERRFITATPDGSPSWAYVARAGDDVRYVRNASATAAKGAARYPFVEPTPFDRNGENT